MARTPRTFSRRGHTETKAGENIGQGKSREDVTEKAKQTDQQKQISDVSPTRSPSRFVGVLRLLRLHNARFHGGGMRDDRIWREGVLSLKHGRYNETKKYHRAQQSPHENDWLPWNENLHGRTSGDEERRTNYRHYTAEKPHASMNTVLLRGDFSWLAFVSVSSGSRSDCRTPRKYG